MPPSRHLLAIPVLAAGLVSLSFVSGFLWRLVGDGIRGPSDLAQYRHLRVLSADEFPTNDPSRRVIIVGDIHGMKTSLDKLLEKVAYDGHNDVLVHTGDFLTRAHHNSSMQVLQFMASNNITGVRGNHDQTVIEWKGWITWINTIPEGKIWLSNLHDKWLRVHSKPSRLREWAQEQREGYFKHYNLRKWVQEQRERCSRHDAKWWKHLPEKWLLFGDHYKIAEEMTEEQYAYLLSLPLKLHIPSAHTFIVHAGLLPYDVRYPYDDKRRQPLARAPRFTAYSPFRARGPDEHMIQAMRRLQEEDLLRRIPQNRDPWTNLNIRSVLKKHKVTRKPYKGTPWAEFWNDQMSLCGGFNNDLDFTSDTNQQYMYTSDDSQQNRLSCYPSSVVYGHAATRGLDINRWTIGLDSGCIYGRKLTALILGPNPMPGGNHEDDEDELLYIEDSYDREEYGAGYETGHGIGKMVEVEDMERNVVKKKARTVKFGDEDEALIVSVKCPRP